jgi:ABC-type transport system involved in cytochrome c biogenesis permease subunit
MNLILYSLFPALLLLLFGGLISTWVHLTYRPDGHVEAVTYRLGWIALGAFVIWMSLITLQQRQVPVVTIGQLAAFLAFLIWAGQTYVQTRVRQRLLSVLPMATVVVLILIGIAAGVKPGITPQAMQGPWVAFHITLSLAGTAMLLGSGVFAAGSLVMHRHLEYRRFDQVYSHLPSLEEMYRLRRVSLYGGWALISLSLSSAFLWVVAMKSDSSMVISHMHPMVTLWVVVSALALAERLRWFKRQRLAALTVILSALVFVLVLVSVIGIFWGMRT